MIILGIDPGLAHTGWGVVETRGTRCRARAYGCITTTPEEAVGQRLHRIFSEIATVISNYHPTQLAIEKVFFGENARSAVATAQARGAAIVACAHAGLIVDEYTPMQIKQAIVGTGSADKYQVAYMVRSVLALDHHPRPDHAADALAAAVCHANLTHGIGALRKGGGMEVRAVEQNMYEQKREEAREVTAAARAARAGREVVSATPEGRRVA